MNIVSKHTLFSNSATGSKHVQDGLSNEDSVLTLEHDDYQIVAVADGHGARECFRSEIGSRLAVDVAVKNLELFAQTIKRYDLYSYLEQEKERDELVRSLIQDIVDHWNQYVYADIKAYPIQDDEYERAQTLSSIYQKGMYLTNIYGSTLLAALMTPEYILIVQQGDGTCAVFNEDGSLDDPMPEDDLCIRNLTTSLCDKDALRVYRPARKRSDGVVSGKRRRGTLVLRHDPLVGVLRRIVPGALRTGRRRSGNVFEPLAAANFRTRLP
ncbi:protein phosphatase 2C domain-containing protein [uncultured Dubosiella sp.]|uniref:protein phosphatase 2C domain-containing protein n=1 Tax=uncultured Dubosiella sp. TaxID=1937011 RepID=UPI0025B59798|nr:protein phosphatase 2C domain-containing protein [uncultured Dubosiella sp.]